MADSGRTLQFVYDICGEYTDQIKVAVLYQKPTSVIDCDFVWKPTSEWIAFPWSSLPPVNGESNRDN